MEVLELEAEDLETKSSVIARTAALSCNATPDVVMRRSVRRTPMRWRKDAEGPDLHDGRLVELCDEFEDREVLGVLQRLCRRERTDNTQQRTDNTQPRTDECNSPRAVKRSLRSTWSAWARVECRVGGADSVLRA